MAAATDAATPGATQVRVPDIGGFTDIPIIEVLVRPGDLVNADDPLITLESDKATMEIPAPSAGRVGAILVSVGDRVSEGSPVLTLEGGAAAEAAPPPSLIEQQEPPPTPAPPPVTADPAPIASGGPVGDTAAVGPGQIHASPAVRRLARELGVDLARLNGTGEKGRITKEDVAAALRAPAAAPASAPAVATGTGIPEIPAQDFSRFGPIEVQALPRIKRISGPFLHRSWLNVPHVTHHDEADITELEAYRKELDAAAKDRGYRVTLLSFLMKAAVVALKQFPEVNSSLSPEKDSLILKQYYHLGIAVDTPEGLVVPVIRDVDRKGITELSRELGAVSARARDGKLTPTDLQGATFTISSLGGIGGTGFTPIVNAPEVAILGVARAKMAPVWNGESFIPRLLVPLAVSYDHRVIDGALAARFTRQLCHVIEDVRRLLL